MQSIINILNKEYITNLNRITNNSNKIKNIDLNTLETIKQQLQLNMDNINVLINKEKKNNFKKELKTKLEDYVNSTHKNNNLNRLICLLITEQLYSNLELDENQNNYEYCIFDSIRISCSNNILKFNDYNYCNNVVNKQLIFMDILNDLNNYNANIISKKYNKETVNLLINSIFDFIGVIDKFIKSNK